MWVEIQFNDDKPQGRDQYILAGGVTRRFNSATKTLALLRNAKSRLGRRLNVQRSNDKPRESLQKSQVFAAQQDQSFSMTCK